MTQAVTAVSSLTLLAASAGSSRRTRAFDGRSPVSAGVYLFSAALLDEIAAGSASSLEREVFACAPAGSLDAFTGRFPFIDIGTPESLALAEHVIGNHTESPSA